MIELLEKVYRGTVTIMRGLPGSGKTKWAWEHVLEPHGKNAIHCSADNFFYEDEYVTPSPTLDDLMSPEPLPWKQKVYKYDVKKQGEAHAVCMSEFLKAIRDGVPEIVVDNTASRLWEYENYVAIAKMHNYEVKIVEMMCPDKDWIKIFIGRQEHGVPAGVILDMWLRWEADDRVTQEIWP